MSDWGKQLEAERERRGLSRMRAAVDVGVTESTWRSWERGESMPSNLARESLAREKWPTPEVG